MLNICTQTLLLAYYITTISMFCHRRWQQVQVCSKQVLHSPFLISVWTAALESTAVYTQRMNYTQNCRNYCFCYPCYGSTRFTADSTVQRLHCHLTRACALRSQLRASCVGWQQWKRRFERFIRWGKTAPPQLSDRSSARRLWVQLMSSVCAPEHGLGKHLLGHRPPLPGSNHTRNVKSKLSRRMSQAPPSVYCMPSSHVLLTHSSIKLWTLGDELESLKNYTVRREKWRK